MSIQQDRLVAEGAKILDSLRERGFSDRDTLAIGDQIVLGSVVELANGTPGLWDLLLGGDA